MKKLLFLILLALIFCHAGFAQTGTWQQLIGKGEQAYNNGNYEQATKNFELACPLIEKAYGKQHPEYVICLSNLAELYRVMGSYAKAEPLFLEALKIGEKIFSKLHPDYASTLNNLALLYQNMGSYAKAGSLFMEALQIKEKTLGRQHPEYATSLSNVAVLYQDIGNYAKAGSMFMEALQIREKTLGRQHPLYAASLNKLAVLYKSMGSYDQAEPLNLEALQITEKALGKQHPKYVIALNSLAKLYTIMGSYAQAEPLHLEALQTTEKTLGKQHPDYAIALNSLAFLYRAMGSYAQAEPLLLEALQIREKTLGKQHPEYAASLNNLAIIYTSMGSYAKATPLYLEALQTTEKLLGKQHPEYASALNNLALFYRYMGSYAQAEPLFLEALQTTEKILGKQHPDYATSLNNLALLYRDMGSYAKAEPLLLEALQIKGRTLGKQHPGYVLSLSTLAVLYQEIGSYAKAEPLYLESHQNLLGQIKNYFPGLSEKDKLTFYQENIGSAFESFCSFVLMRQTANPLIIDNLYNNLLATKGLLFQSQNKIRNAIFSSGDTSLVKVYQQWQAQRNFLARVYQMSLAQKQQAGIDQAQLEKNVNDLEKQLSTRSEAYAQAADKTLYTWQQVQKALKPGEAAVEMVRFRYYNKQWTDTIYYVALLLTSASKQPAFILLANGKELESKYTTLYRSAVPGQRDIQPGQGAAGQQADAAQLYQQFWSPISKHPSFQDVRTIYFAGDGVYHQLNLQTLFNPSTKQYLLDEMNIHLVGSTRDLLTRKKRNSSLAKATLLGYPAYNDHLVNDQQAAVNSAYPALSRAEDVNRLFRGDQIKELPGTKTEVTGIAQLLRQQKIDVDLLTGTQATESALKRVWNPNILHIATHGFFRKEAEDQQEKAVFLGMEKATIAENPLLRSGLLLAGCQSAFDAGKRGSGEDGVLTAYEAMSLNLDQTDLVVLSACETGLGQIRNGEGVYGLQRAFQTAGAKAVLMSLWKVDDAATQQLMRSFYKHWLTSTSIRTAFRQAQQELRNKYPQPYFWGAFVLLGE